MLEWYSLAVRKFWFRVIVTVAIYSIHPLSKLAKTCVTWIHVGECKWRTPFKSIVRLALFSAKIHSGAFAYIIYNLKNTQLN